jgi:hypothetical protein
LVLCFRKGGHRDNGSENLKQVLKEPREIHGSGIRDPSCDPRNSEGRKKVGIPGIKYRESVYRY